MAIHDPIMIRAATKEYISDMLRLERYAPTAAHWSEAQYGYLFEAAEGSNQSLALLAEWNLAPEGSDQTPTMVAFLVARNLGPEWELENIVVAPEVRGQGVGRRLMEALLARADQANSHSVFLEVRESNAPARGLYEKLGFQQTGRRRCYYNNPLEDAILYRKNLG